MFRMNEAFTLKLEGIYPALYAAYTPTGEINLQAVEDFCRHLAKTDIQGLYVGGSSGECIYQSVEEREAVLETVVKALGDSKKIIAHVACNNTADSCRLARHAEHCGVAAIAAIPPIYFHLPRRGIADYWLAMIQAAPRTPFIIYNIPQLAGVALDPELLNMILEAPQVIGVKNSSMSTFDIARFRHIGEAQRENFTVFNGPDEQLLSGLIAGASGGIGGTYAAFPELYTSLYQAYITGDFTRARELQDLANLYIAKLLSYEGNLYAVAKALILDTTGIDLGSVRAPLSPLTSADQLRLNELFELHANLCRLCQLGGQS